MSTATDLNENRSDNGVEQQRVNALSSPVGNQEQRLLDAPADPVGNTVGSTALPAAYEEFREPSVATKTRAYCLVLQRDVTALDKLLRQHPGWRHWRSHGQSLARVAAKGGWHGSP